MPTEQDISSALYTDDQGSVVGLDEVQLLDPIPSRVPLLIEILAGSDERAALAAAQVLAAWGRDEGLDALERFVDGRGHLRGTWEPHRLHGYDNVYDLIARATRLYEVSGGAKERVERMYCKLLTLYGECQFESRLKDALMKWNGTSLLQLAVAAFERSLKFERVYLASQLLPVVIRWSEDMFWQLLGRLNGRQSEPDWRFNEVEALAYWGGLRAEQELALLAREGTGPVAAQAHAAIGVPPGAVFTGDYSLDAYRAYECEEGGGKWYGIEWASIDVLRVTQLVVAGRTLTVHYQPADRRLTHAFASKLIETILLRDFMRNQYERQVDRISYKRHGNGLAFRSDRAGQ